MAARAAGCTAVLELHGEPPGLERLRGIGWGVSVVTSQERMVEAARAFARRHYDPRARATVV